MKDQTATMGSGRWAKHALRSFLLPLLVVGASAAGAQMPREANTPAIPMPRKVEGTDYSSIAQLAALLPAGRIHEAPAIGPPQSHPSNNKRKSRRAGTTKVMIAGDSMTQGKEGDWTWRYRMWQWAQSNGLSWDFVGPYTGTRNQPDPAPPSPPLLYGQTASNDTIIATGGYAAGVDAGFDSDHFAIWGRALAEDVGEIKDVVAANPPDIMLVMLGFNDLGWFYSDADGLWNNLHTFLYNARQSKPDITFLVANVPQRTSLGRQDLPAETTKYNGILEGNYTSLSTAQSPVHLVKLQQNYNCNLDSCPVGYDGLHPNILGEYEIAQAFTNTLVNDLKIGSAPLSIPSNPPSRPVPVPTNFQVVASPGGITATWDKVYGAYGYNVRSKIDGYTDWATGNVGANRFDAQWPLANYTYDVQVQTACGEGCAGDWTSVGSAVAAPQTASAPTNIHVSSSGTSLTVTFDPPTGPYSDSIIEYDLLWWDQTQPCSWIGGGGFKGSPATVNNLIAGHQYFVAIDTWNKNGEGFPAVLNQVIIGGGTPSTPTGLKITANDATTAHLTWDAVSGAAGYDLWTRNVNNASDVSKPQNITRTGNCADDGLLFPGVWNYEFCVQAVNGDDKSPKGPCVVAPSPTSGVTEPTCATPVHQSTGCAFGATPTFSNTPDGPVTTAFPTHDKPSPTPTATSTSTSLKPYQTIDCGSDIVHNADREAGSDIWKGLDVQDAWTDAQSFWETDPSKPASYEWSQEMAYFFNVSNLAWNCAELTYGGDQDCKNHMVCQDVKTPAGWFIMNSIAGIETIIADVTGVIHTAEAYTSDKLPALVKAFGDVPTNNISPILSIVSLGLGMLGTPMFGDLIKEFNNVKEGLGDTIAAVKDATTNLAGQSISMANYILGDGGGQTAISEQNSLQDNVAGIIRTWEYSMTNVTAKIFNGTPDSITEILHLIIDGAFFTSSKVTTTTEEQWIDSALSPLLIAAAWGLGNDPTFILDSNKTCSNPPPKAPVPASTYVCVNNHAYFLASASGGAYGACTPSNPHQICNQQDFSAPPGLSALNGTAWGGVKMQDFVIGSVNTFNANGQKNGVGQPPDFATSLTGQIFDAYTNGFAPVYQYQGFFNLPVCQAAEAQSNWRETSAAGEPKTKNYPCN